MKRTLLALLALALPATATEKLEKWIYKSTNLLVAKNADDVIALIERGHAAGYTHMLLADSKFSRLMEMDERYFKNVARVKAAAAKSRIEIVPALFSIGYSNDILARDVNLVEAIPVRDVPLVVKNGAAVVDDKDAPTLPGGKFDDRKGWSFADDVVHFENGAARITDAKGVNARVTRRLKVQPWRQYHVSVRIKTQDFRGEPEIKALTENGAQLCWSNLGVKQTQDWQVHHTVFNSQENTSVSLYFGIWSGSSGSLWWDDASIETVSFMNMPRRDGCPLTVRIENGRALVEGHDFGRLDDPLMGMKPWKGEFDVWHEPPTMQTKLPDGTRLLASYYHTQTIYNGQAMICPSESKTYDLLRDQAQRVHKLWGAKGYMMNHDEVRLLNHCEACRKRALTPGQILADNVKRCIAILREVNPGGRIHVWSDMFDPNHNAVTKNYYLVNGDLTGSWEGLDKEVIILPWHFEKRAKSMKFFADRGHRQVIAGYYDAKPGRIRDWLTATEGINGVLGVMYTTWRNNYSDLEGFAKAADAAP